MKKSLFLAFLPIFFLFIGSCSESSYDDSKIDNFVPSATQLETNVKLGVSKSGGVGLFLIMEDVEEYDVDINTKFSIRIDNRIPKLESDGYSFNANEYITITDDKGKMVYGTLDGTAPYKIPSPPARTSPSERGHDCLRYLFSSDGTAVEAALKEKPSDEQVVECLKRNARTKNLDFSNVKVIWYVAKMQNEILWNRRNYWHVDGILTFKETENIDSIPNGKPTEP